MFWAILAHINDFFLLQGARLREVKRTLWLNISHSAHKIVIDLKMGKMLINFKTSDSQKYQNKLTSYLCASISA